MPRLIIALVLCLFCCRRPASSHCQTAAGRPDTGLRISTTTQLVVEDVLIKGKDGKPITDLKASDFTITEDGKPQNINIFEFQALDRSGQRRRSAKPTVVPSNAIAANSGVKPVTTVEFAPERPGDLKYRNRRLMVMFFDMTSMPIQDQIAGARPPR